MVSYSIFGRSRGARNVLILVVVDNGLVPCSKFSNAFTRFVLILVVVDNGLVLTVGNLEGERTVKS